MQRLLIRSVAVPVILFSVVTVCGNAAETRKIAFGVSIVGSSGQGPETVRIRLAPAVGTDVPHGLPETVDVELDPKAQTSLSLRMDLAWTARAEADGYWGPERTVNPRDVDGKVVLQLFPTGDVTAPLEVPRMGEPPGRVEVRFEPVGDGTHTVKEPRGTVGCSLEEKTVRCSLPAGVLDLRFSVPPWAPAYRFGVQIVAGQELEMDPLHLVRGASVSGFVVTEAGDPAPAGTKVRLSLPNEKRTVTEPRLDLVRQTTKTDQHGFFQFRGVRAGHYGLVAQADGYAPARAEPIEAKPDLESQLKDPLVLARPITAELDLIPPVDPWGKAWTVRLSQLNQEGDSLSSVKDQASKEGILRWTGLSPGRYQMAILGSEDSRWLEEKVELLGGEDPLVVQVPLIEIHGTLTKGDEPAPGRLWFGSRHGAKRIGVHVDADGDFSGYLPKAGTWPLDWIPAGGRDIQVALEPVEVPDRSRVSLSIRVPDVELQGDVVDEHGDPVADARVRIVGDDRDIQSSSLTTDDDGEFSMPGLKPGNYGVAASKGEVSSEMVPVTLSEGLDSPDLHLVLRTTVELSGLVESGGRPVSGARVTAWPDLGSSPGVSFVDAVTDPEGFFSVKVPGEPVALNIVVNAKGFGIEMERLPVAPGQVADVELDPYPGTLTVAGDLRQAGSAFLVHGGSFLPLLGLIRIAGLDLKQALGGQDLVISGLEPGLYLVCKGQQVLSSLRNQGAEPSAGCTSGVIPPLGALRLELPTAAHSGSAPGG